MDDTTTVVDTLNLNTKNMNEPSDYAGVTSHARGVAGRENSAWGRSGGLEQGELQYFNLLPFLRLLGTVLFFFSFLAPAAPAQVRGGYSRGDGPACACCGPSWGPGWGWSWYDPFPWGWGYPYVYPFQPYSGQVKIDRVAKNALVYVDGGYAGTAGELKRFILGPGNHEIELRDPSGQTFQKERIHVVPGKTLEIRGGSRGR